MVVSTSPPELGFSVGRPHAGIASSAFSSDASPPTWMPVDFDGVSQLPLPPDESSPDAPLSVHPMQREHPISDRAYLVEFRNVIGLHRGA